MYYKPWNAFSTRSVRVCPAFSAHPAKALDAYKGSDVLVTLSPDGFVTLDPMVL
jgi:hypothetical protein